MTSLTSIVMHCPSVTTTQGDKTHTTATLPVKLSERFQAQAQDREVDRPLGLPAVRDKVVTV